MDPKPYCRRETLLVPVTGLTMAWTSSALFPIAPAQAGQELASLSYVSYELSHPLVSICMQRPGSSVILSGPTMASNDS